MTTIAPRLFALIIGIDKYEHLTPKLSGAVADASAMMQFLSTKASAVRTIFLQNEGATRTAIIEGFRALQKWNEIEKDDPIVVYFAGHGSEAKIQVDEEYTQMLLPYDASPRTPNPEELPVVAGIPDYLIRDFLNDIAKEKGNNITVIFDCCHAGHGTRDEFISPGTVRRADVPLMFRDDSNERGSFLAEKYVGKDLWSHVLLSACKHDQRARETRQGGMVRGYFTVALLEGIKNAGPTITYNELFRHLPILENQHPQCEGYHQNRVLFTVEEQPSRFEVCYREHDKSILMDGGTAQGVTGDKEEEFVVSDGDLTFSLNVEKVHLFHSTMKSCKGEPWPFEDRIVTAFLKVPGESARLRVYITPDSDTLDMELKRAKIQQLFLCSDTKDKANLVLQLSVQKDVTITITDRRVTDHGLSELGNIPIDSLESVIRAAQHYYWHLFRRNISLAKNITPDDLVILDFYKLREEDDMGFTTKVVSDGDPIKKDIVGNDVVVKVTADNETMYGVELKNNTNQSLYPYLFFFDNSDLSIQPYFLPPSGAGDKVDPPLKPHGKLTIGYSDTGRVHPGGSGPFVYECRPGQDVDVGFLKLFLSNVYINLSTLLQGVTTALDLGHHRASKQVTPKPAGATWDALVVTVVQERPEGRNGNAKAS